MTWKGCTTAAALSGVLLVGALGASPASGRAEGAGGTGLFETVAASSGVHVTVTMPKFVVVDKFIDGGGPTAQASLSTLEGPAAYAAHPYPGDVALGLPGIFKVLGVPVDAPAYPFYVNASPTRPEATLSQPGYDLEAKAAPTDASASARSGQTGNETTVGHTLSSARTWTEGGTHRALALSTTDLFQAGPLRLAGVRSRAEATATDPDKAPTLAGTLEVAAASIAGVPVTLTSKGLALAGTSVPLPADHPLNKALADTGMSVEYLSTQTSADTVAAPALKIRWAHTVPGADRELQVTYVIGHSVAHAKVTASGGNSGVPEVELPALTGPTGSGPAPETPQPTAAGGSGFLGSEPSSARASGSGAVPVGNDRPATAAGSGAVPAGGNEAAPVPPNSEPVAPVLSAAQGGAGQLKLGSSAAAEGVYLVLAGAALLAALALHGLRQLGVRAPARGQG